MSSLLVLLLVLCLLVVTTTAAPIDPDSHKNITEIITSKGYPCEQHFITTSDSYILGVQRIPHGRNSNTNAQKQVVFLQHGIFDSAHTWVANFPTQSLAFLLADAGFDVWLGNARGNVYSRNSTKYNPKGSDFWNFSIDQLGKDDLPAVVEYILTKTGQSKIRAYVGHSQGCAEAFMAFTSDPEYWNSKVGSYFALAPVTYISNTGSPLFNVLAKLHLDYILKLLGPRDFLPSTEVIRLLLPEICHDMPAVCRSTYCLVCGCDLKFVNQSRLPVYFSHIPAGTSTLGVIQWTQFLKSGHFQHYDFGSSAANVQHYKQPTPPLYYLNQLQVPTYIYYGGKDTLSDPVDVRGWLPMISSSVLKHTKFIEEYGHGDFVWGVNANEFVYSEILQFLKN